MKILIKLREAQIQEMILIIQFNISYCFVFFPEE
jgi:hypothetical protein